MATETPEWKSDLARLFWTPMDVDGPSLLRQRVLGLGIHAAVPGPHQLARECSDTVSGILRRVAGVTHWSIHLMVASGCGW